MSCSSNNQLNHSRSRAYLFHGQMQVTASNVMALALACEDLLLVARQRL